MTCISSLSSILSAVSRLDGERFGVVIRSFLSHALLSTNVSAVDELIFTTISGVAAVSFVAFILIPHWSSIAFVMPLIIALYFMLLGTMQYSGIHINSVTYVIIVMAIGLLVDFLVRSCRIVGLLLLPRPTD